jgi:hypothetical protein
MDRQTADKNLRLGLVLALFAAFMFVASFGVAEIVINA